MVVVERDTKISSCTVLLLLVYIYHTHDRDRDLFLDDPRVRVHSCSEPFGELVSVVVSPRIAASTTYIS